MINQAKVDEVRRLLAEGRLSQRQIASLAGISRGTIGSIASGKRTDRLPQPTSEWDEPQGPVVRCPGCGGRVFSPCRLCRVRELKTGEIADRRQSAGRDPAGSERERRHRFDPTQSTNTARRS